LQLALVGVGPRREEFEALAASLGVRDRVHFLGFQSNPHRLVSRSCMFVLSSRYEGFPNAMLEAMICGVPVIATDCRTGPREILGDSRHGLLVPNIATSEPRVVERALSDAIVEMRRPERHSEFARRARERSRDFDERLLRDRWSEIL
jgi:glycosyltransferase involved in cell wall biosynthesis